MPRFAALALPCIPHYRSTFYVGCFRPVLRSARITGPHRYYGWLRLPGTTARVLSFCTCSQVPASGGPTVGSPWLPRTLNVRLDKASDPGEYHAARQRPAPVVAYRRAKTVGTHQRHFSGLNTFKVGSARYLCTSPAFVPTHRLVCYQPRRKARYWARGARLPRRDSHPLEHAVLPGRTVPNYLPAHRVGP
jgi:hypothetical protein